MLVEQSLFEPPESVVCKYCGAIAYRHSDTGGLMYYCTKCNRRQ